MSNVPSNTAANWWSTGGMLRYCVKVVPTDIPKHVYADSRGQSIETCALNCS